MESGIKKKEKKDFCKYSQDLDLNLETTVNVKR